MKKGLYWKYNITKTDGTPVDPDAEYFVLRVDKDPHALPAIESYANSIADENTELAVDIRKKVRELSEDGSLCMQDVDAIAKKAYETDCVNGFWDDYPSDVILATKIALIHSEVSELLEELRKESRNYESIGTEIADIILRSLILAQALEIPIGFLIKHKMLRNQNRPHKHGKRF